MAEPAFIAMGDLHLDTRIWKSRDDITGDACLAFSALLDLGIEWGVPLVLLGDIFDTQAVPTELIRFFRAEMDRCQNEGVPVYFIQGNHDRRTPPWCSSVHGYPVHIGDGVPVDIGGVSCVGLDYSLKEQARRTLEELLSLDPCPSTLFLHQAVKQALRFEGAWNFDLEWVPPGIRLVVMGDIHKEMEFQIGETRALYTGVSHLRELPQRGPHSCVLVNRDLTTSRLPLPYRPVERFSIRADHQLLVIRDWLSESLASGPPLPPLAWVYHTSEFTAEVLRLRLEFDGVAVIISELLATQEELDLSELEADSIVPISAVQHELPSAEELLVKILDPEVDKVAFELVMTLLTGADDKRPVEVIQEFGQRVLGEG